MFGLPDDRSAGHRHHIIVAMLGNVLLWQLGICMLAQTPSALGAGDGQLEDLSVKHTGTSCLHDAREA